MDRQQSLTSPDAETPGHARDPGRASDDRGQQRNQETPRKLAEQNAYLCFRLRHIPSDWTKDRVLRALHQECDLPRDLKIRLTLCPSIIKPSFNDGLLSVEGPADILDGLAPPEPDKDKQLVEYDGVQITIDRHFYGLTPLNNPGSAPVADIIAVTGLAGNAFASWMDRDSKKMWLHDFLPGDLHHPVRIMTYGFNTALKIPTDRVDTLGDLTRSFLTQVIGCRESDKKRPLFLIGHSLGGIIITKALLMCKQQDDEEDYRNIFDAAKLLVFFGAPHQGIHTEALETMVAKMKLASMERSQKLLLALTYGSEYLQDHADSMKSVWKGRKIISLFETKKTAVVIQDPVTGQYKRGGESILMVPKSSALLRFQNEIEIAVDQDHSNMSKFMMQNDEMYGVICRRIGEMLESLPGIKKPIVPEDEAVTEHHKACVRGLRVTDYRSYRDKLFQRRQGSTCSWVLDDSSYTSWIWNGPRMLDIASVLWVDGGPGFGKSVMASFLSKEIPKRSADARCFAFFFCDDKDEKLRTGAAILRHWLAQIILQIPATFEHFMMEEAFKCASPKDNVEWTFGMLARILKSILSDPVTPSIYLLVDALDECESESQAHIIRYLSSIFNRPNISHRLLITSRSHVSIEQHFTPLLRISLRPKSSQPDIIAYVESEMQSLSMLPADIVAEIREKLLEKAQGMFLWVSLVVQDFRKAARRSRREIRRMLQDDRLPSDIPAIYRRILSRISPEDLPIARRVLRWVTWAVRPMKFEELRALSALQPDYTTFQELEDEMVPDFKSLLLDMFGSMLTLEDDLDPLDPFTRTSVSKSYHLVHQSARDFLTGTEGLQWFNTDTEVDSVINPHAELTLGCFNHITIFHQHWRLQGYRPIEVMRKSPEFPSYAFMNAFQHFRLAPESNPYYCNHELWARFVQEVSMPDNWTKFKRLADHRPIDTYLVPLTFFRHEGITICVDLVLLSMKKHVNSLDDAVGALCYAVMNDIWDLYQVLLDYDVNPVEILAGKDYRSSLIECMEVSIRVGELKCTKDILEKLSAQTDVRLEGHHLRPCLRGAVARGNRTMFRFLFEYGVPLGSLYSYPLHAAIGSGDEEIVGIFIKTGADVNYKNQKSETALYYALKTLKKHLYRNEVCKLLVQGGADVNSACGSLGNPLQSAARFGYPEEVELFLHHSAEPNATGGKFGCALQAGVVGKSLQACAKLILGGANVDLECGKYGNALLAALHKGCYDIALLLIEHGATLNLQSPMDSRFYQKIKDKKGTFTARYNLLVWRHQLKLKAQAAEKRVTE